MAALEGALTEGRAIAELVRRTASEASMTRIEVVVAAARVRVPIRPIHKSMGEWSSHVQSLDRKGWSVTESLIFEGRKFRLIGDAQGEVGADTEFDFHDEGDYVLGQLPGRHRPRRVADRHRQRR